MDFSAFLYFLEVYAPWLWVIFGLILVFCLWVIWRRRKKKKNNVAPLSAGGVGSGVVVADSSFSAKIKPTFRSGLARINRYFKGRKGRYNLPWFVMIGPEGTKKTELLHGCGLSRADNQPVNPDDPCRWWLFEEGVLLDVDSRLLSLHEAENDRNWRSVANLLYRARSRKAFDGMVLTISARDLMASGEHRALEAEKRAAVLYRRLLTLQKTAGVVFPIHVVITHSEAIPGFEEMTQEIPESLRDQMFGWSSPYDLRDPYNPEWVSDAFNAMLNRVHELQLEAAHNGFNPEIKDNFFRFPRELANLAGPLRIWLDAVFSRTAYHEPFFLRGISFCSSTQIESSEVTAESTSGTETDGFHSAPRSRTFFLKELLSHKVFAEANLARPTRDKLGHTRVRTNIMRAATVLALALFSLGVFTEYRNLDENVEVLSEQLEHVYGHLRTVETRMSNRRDAGSSSGRSTAQDSLRTGYTDLFQAIETYRENRFYSPLLPSSLTGPLWGDIESGFAFGYRQIILSSLDLRLLEKEDALLAPLSPLEARACEESGNRTPFVKMKSFIEMETWLEDMKALHQSFEIYSGLGTRFHFESFTQLIRFAFDNPNYEVKAEHETEYRTALRYLGRDREEQISIGSEDMVLASSKALVLYDHFLNELFQNDCYLENKQQSLISQINNQYDWLNMPLPEARWRLEYLADSLEEIEQALPYAVFLVYETDLGESFSELLTEVQAAPFLANNNDDLMFTMYNRKRAYYESSIDPDFLDKAFQFRTAIRELFNLFLLEDIEQAPDTNSRDSFKDWYQQDLSRALNLYQNFSNFRDTRLANLPDGYWSPALESLAVRAFNEHIEGVIERMPRLVYESRKSEQVHFFLRTMPRLQELVGVLFELDLQPTVVQMVSKLNLTIFDLFELIEADLYASELFKLDLQKWDGNGPFLKATLGLQDAQAVDDYFEEQLDEVRDLVWIARHLIRILEKQGPFGPDINQDTVNRWRAIMNDLEDFDQMAPYPIVRQLEQFFLVDLRNLKMENCARVTADYQTSSGYFRKVFNDLKRDIGERCLELDTSRQYHRGQAGFSRDVMAVYDNQLSGRSPFITHEQATIGPDLDAATIRDFYRDFRDWAPQRAREYVELFDSLNPEQRRQLDFIRQMEANQPFFDVVTDPVREGAYVEIRQRVAAPYEKRGNQVMQRTITRGENANVKDGERFIWRLGEPINISFRWAKDSPTLPKVMKTETLSSDGITVKFSYKGTWALTRLLGDHGYPGEGMANMLRFEIPMVSNAEQPVPAGYAVLLMEVTIFDADGTPVAAPTLPKGTSTLHP
jgi:type VI secretion system protein ImpL